MALGKVCQLVCGTPGNCRPIIDVSTKVTTWRLANVAMAAFFLVFAYAQLNIYDWWLWGPIYFISSLLCISVTICPKSVDHPLWRVFCATVIVFGLIYLVYLIWIVRDVATGYLQNPMDFDDGRELAGLSVAILWAVICRLTAKTSDGIVVYIRFVTLVGILLVCLPIFAWSLCFYSSGQMMLPYCKYMFATGDKDV